MKKIILITGLTIIYIFGFGQSFPGENPELLLNKIVKPKVISESLQTYSYKNFYVEFDKEKKQFTKSKYKNRPFPNDSSFSTGSDYSKLVGKEFKVIEMFELTPKSSYSSKEYVLELENPEVGKIFYEYNPKIESLFELEVIGGIDYPEDFFCSKIETQIDKFENKETYYSPTENGISFTKTILNGKSNIYLSVRVNGSTLNVGETGFSLLFEDGTKFTKPEEKINANASSGSGWIYSTFILLNPTDIKNFLEKNITDVRLYIYDGTVDNESAMKIKAYLKCLTK